jgi:RNA polymerase sigma-70 factor, ECF subfamily
VKQPPLLRHCSDGACGSSAQEQPLRAPGDGKAAFDLLFRENREGLLHFLLRRLRSREDAEDALMQAFYKAWRARDGFRGEATAKQWLYGIASRVAIDILRIRSRHPVQALADIGELEAVDAYDEPSWDPIDTLLASERRAEIHEAIQRLAPEQRRLLHLYYFEGRCYEEIRAVLGLPYTQIRGRLHRIRRRIYQDLIQHQEFHCDRNPGAEN